MNVKDKVFYISLVGIIIAIIACGACYGVGLMDYVGLTACCIAFVGLLYAYYQDHRHEKMKKQKEEAAAKKAVEQDNSAKAE